MIGEKNNGIDGKGHLSSNLAKCHARHSSICIIAKERLSMSGYDCEEIGRTGFFPTNVRWHFFLFQEGVLHRSQRHLPIKKVHQDAPYSAVGWLVVD